MFAGRTPDITPAQIAAILTFVVGQAVAFGWVDGTRTQTLVSAGSIIIAAAWKLADAYLRGQRAKAHGAASPLPTPPAPPAAP